MKKVFSVMLFASLPIISLFNACSKEDPEIVEEQELITTVVLTLTSNGAPDQSVRWTLESADTPTISLQVNQEYKVAISFLSDNLNPLPIDCRFLIRDLEGLAKMML